MKRSLLAFVGVCALLLTSCMDLETSQQLDKIAAMNQTIDSIETVFQEHKLDSLSKISLGAYSIENRIKKYYKVDTIDLALGRKMDAFKVMRRNLGPLGKSRTLIVESIEEERKKLAQLKTDIENGDGKREKYAEFVSFEEAKVDQLSKLLGEYVSTKESALKTYDELYDELNEFSMSLLN